MWLRYWSVLSCGAGDAYCGLSGHSAWWGAFFLARQSWVHSLPQQVGKSCWPCTLPLIVVRG